MVSPFHTPDPEAEAKKGGVMRKFGAVAGMPFGAQDARALFPLAYYKPQEVLAGLEWLDYASRLPEWHRPKDLLREIVAAPPAPSVPRLQ